MRRRRVGGRLVDLGGCRRRGFRTHEDSEQVIPRTILLWNLGGGQELEEVGDAFIFANNENVQFASGTGRKSSVRSVRLDESVPTADK